MLLGKLIEGLDLALTAGSANVEITDLTDDSRAVKPGSAFIARLGPAQNGADYVRDAIARGAVAVIADRGYGDLAMWRSGDVAIEDSKLGTNHESRTTDRSPQASGLKPHAFPGTAAQPAIFNLQSAIALVQGPRIDQPLSGRLAERFFDHPSDKLKLIGITGTNGKTTTAFLIQHLLHRAGIRCGLIGTILVDDGKERRPATLTTPGAIDFSRFLAAMVNNGCTAAVAELSSHALHQGRAAALRVDCAVFTNLTGDHLDYHKFMDNYAAAKAILFESLSPDAVAVVNAEDSYAGRMLQDCSAHVVECRVYPPLNAAPGSAMAQESKLPARVTSSVQGRPVVGVIPVSASIEELAATFTQARFNGPWGSCQARYPLVGRHNAMNLLQAVAAANTVAPLSNTLWRALEECPSPAGRLQRVNASAPADGPQPPTVIVDYAHTHDAMENVLTALRPVTAGKLIIVFGCGGDRDKTKRPKMAAVACRLADRVFITSDNPRTEKPEAIIAEILTGVPEELRSARKVLVDPDRAAAIRAAIVSANSDDVVLLAGKGHEDYQIIGTTKIHFDDTQQAAEALKLWQQQRMAKCGA